MRLGLWITLFFCLVSTGFVQADTWKLGPDQQWQDINTPHSRFEHDVAKLKQLVTNGEAGKAKKAIKQLRADYPQLAGKDVDAFFEAEMLFARRKFALAAAKYEKFMNEYPQSPLYDSALQRKYSIGHAYLSGKKKTALAFIKLHAWDEGATIMEEVADHAGNAPIAKKAMKKISESYSERGEYRQSYHNWAEINRRWPTGEIGKESLLGMAGSLENAYVGPRYDASVLKSSKSYYQNFQDKYPADSQQLDVNAKISKIEKQQAEKKMHVADYYLRTGSYDAAIYYYSDIIQAWPASSEAQRAEKQIAQAKEKKIADEAKRKKHRLLWYL